MPAQNNTPMGAVNQTAHDAERPLAGQAACTRSTSTPMHTTMKAIERADRDQFAQDADGQQAAEGGGEQCR